MFIHIFLAKMKTNDYTKSYSYDRFCFHIICCKEYCVMCSAKKRAIGIENINIRDLSVPRRFIKAWGFLCFRDDVYITVSSKILQHWTPRRWLFTMLSKNLLSRSAKRKRLTWEAKLPAQRENSENGVVDVTTTGDCRQLLSFCAWLNQKMDFRYAVLVSPVLVLKVSISLWRRSSSRLVEALWVGEQH